MANDYKKQKTFRPADNPLETLKDVVVGVGRDIGEVPRSLLDTAIEQLTSKPQRKPMAGEIDLSAGIHKTNLTVERKENNLGAKANYLQTVQRSEKEVFNRQKQLMEQKIAQIMRELQVEVVRLQQQTAELSTDLKKITVETMPANVGIYHLNFFDWVINTLRDLRKRIDQSRMWLNVSSQKKKQKGYWAMYKKHGNNFMMSDERGIATAGG